MCMEIKVNLDQLVTVEARLALLKSGRAKMWPNIILF